MPTAEDASDARFIRTAPNWGRSGLILLLSMGFAVGGIITAVWGIYRSDAIAMIVGPLFAVPGFIFLHFWRRPRPSLEIDRVTRTIRFRNVDIATGRTFFAERDDLECSLDAVFDLNYSAGRGGLAAEVLLFDGFEVKVALLNEMFVRIGPIVEFLEEDLNSHPRLRKHSSPVASMWMRGCIASIMATALAAGVLIIILALLGWI